jgi:hypothetical protein
MPADQSWADSERAGLLQLQVAAIPVLHRRAIGWQTPGVSVTHARTSASPLSLRHEVLQGHHRYTVKRSSAVPGHFKDL